MKKHFIKIFAILLAITAVFTYNVQESRAQQDVSAKSAILIEAVSGRVLFEKNALEKMPMASTTKIMTAIIAIENCSINDTVVVGQNASGVEGSSIWLSVGEKMSLLDMLFGLMLASGNDAAIAIAEHVGQNVENFVTMMNQKAKDIGAYNTNFVNPNGLPDDNHYTTAYDLALISAYAMQLNVFREIVKTQYKTIPWEGHEWDRVVKNKNKILWNYDGGNGIKTGYTKQAGRCLCAAAERDGMQLVSVVLSAPDMFGDCMSMLNSGFENFSYKKILEADEFIGSVDVLQGMEDNFKVFTGSDAYYPLTDEEYGKLEKRIYIDKSVDAPVVKDQKVGYIDILLGENKIYTVALTAPESIGENSYKFNLSRLLDSWINKRILQM